MTARKHNRQHDFARTENVERAKRWRCMCGDQVDISFVVQWKETRLMKQKDV